ncbi:putative mitochondrial protein [Trifolium repens]|nr:putative mitochondrial protein [Trifolium repens]
MIKSVLQAIPSYVMSVYLIPETTIKEIERMINSFWWGGGTNNRGIKWLAWDRMSYPKEFGGLGFRDLHFFNLAMVAKQGWNFMMKPNTLVAKVYKARYFPKTSFFDSNLGSNPSYAWRSIWKSKKVLINGCRWRIGDGTTIKVMNEPWLKKEDGLWIQAPQEQGVYQLSVNQLMLPNEKMWDYDKIKMLFPLHVVNKILAVPLFDETVGDKLIWQHDLHGIYSVKSAYNMLLNQIDAIAENDKVQWKGIWNSHAPPKAKHLIWRICKGCLPTRSRLQERYVPCQLDCPLCENEIENDWHFLFECNDSRRAWQTAGLESVIMRSIQRFNTPFDCLLDICSNTDVVTAGKVAMVVWVLWNNRNNWVWNQTKESGQQLGVTAIWMWNEWNEVQAVRNSSNSREQQFIQWQRPQQNWFKCNVDASFHHDIGKTSMGWCVRDSLGRFVLDGSIWINGMCTVNEGEAMAILAAMKDLHTRGYTNVNRNIFTNCSKCNPPCAFRCVGI